MSVSLAFNSAKNPAFKVADFTSIEEKNAYVEAEMSDLACKDAYIAYQSARNLKARRDAGGMLDSVRWSFYKRWRKARSDPAPTPAPKGVA